MSGRRTRFWWVGVGALFAGVAGLLSAADELEDGIYRVTRVGTRRVEVLPVFENERLLIHDYRYFPKLGGAERPRQLLVVGIVPDVPLALAERPRSFEGQGEDGGGVVELRLAAPQAVLLREFTAAHPRAGLALVVDGEVVMTERIREPIGDGRFEVRGCRPEACDFLEQQLRDNVMNSPGAPPTAE